MSTEFGMEVSGQGRSTAMAPALAKLLQLPLACFCRNWAMSPRGPDLHGPVGHRVEESLQNRPWKGPICHCCERYVRVSRQPELLPQVFRGLDCTSSPGKNASVMESMAGQQREQEQNKNRGRDETRQNYRGERDTGTTVIHRERSQ